MKKFYLITLFVIFLDQITKFMIVHYVSIGESIPVIKDFFYITSLRNQGAAFSILQGKRVFFIILTLFAVAFLMYYIPKFIKTSVFSSVGLLLILGGAIGNLIDRVFYGKVVDFILVYIGTYPFAVFNIADSALTIGITMLFIYILFFQKKLKQE